MLGVLSRCLNLASEPDGGVSGDGDAARSGLSHLDYKTSATISIHTLVQAMVCRIEPFSVYLFRNAVAVHMQTQGEHCHRPALASPRLEFLIFCGAP